jgi:hypothetical protein
MAKSRNAKVSGFPALCAKSRGIPLSAAQHLRHGGISLLKGCPMLPLTPHGYWRIVLQASQILTESHTVIALRLSGMAGLWPMAEVENQRMISEKLTAATQATHAAIRTGAAGGSLSDIAMAAMKPVGRRTEANAKRLTKAARKTP